MTVLCQDDSPVAWLKRHGHLSERQAMAAERIQRDYYLACLSPHVTQGWDMLPATRTRRGPHEPLTPTETQVAARQRFHAAIDAVGPGLADVLWRVVCEGTGLDAAERELGWPRRAGKLVLGLALDRLADHYDPSHRNPSARSPFLRPR
ncbi:DUF6456 domain-containing protein [Pedomonas mirosovicensis]|uniref:DUF6456 domain-containing protein n=1 Tax=Pedomonas mirosovicensis TaxID=2908641 RepID=UPI002166E5DC|nr:DUF6456 domain-containing protein [Pedomonas mirosovicensis]MCH8684845.1 DUF6456 domain-containing protein [Pedomonas mirosovicensis]